jgi:hypothetical protein
MIDSAKAVVIVFRLQNIEILLRDSQGDFAALISPMLLQRRYVGARPRRCPSVQEEKVFLMGPPSVKPNSILSQALVGLGLQRERAFGIVLKNRMRTRERVGAGLRYDIHMPPSACHIPRQNCCLRLGTPEPPPAQERRVENLSVLILSALSTVT